MELLGIEFTEVGDNFLKGKMPVDARTKQPEGLLHGGASMVLIETLASVAGNIVIDRTKEFCVGLEINANHISSCTGDWVIGTTTPFHLGKATQVWDTKIFQEDRLVCIGRMTLMVLRRKKV